MTKMALDDIQETTEAWDKCRPFAFIHSTLSCSMRNGRRTFNCMELDPLTSKRTPMNQSHNAYGDRLRR